MPPLSRAVALAPAPAGDLACRAPVAARLRDRPSDSYTPPPPPLRAPTLSALPCPPSRQADPLCSFGDFAALSDPVDVETAEFLKSEVSDGIIAPDYSPEALAILAAKKKGGFIVLKARGGFEPPLTERRDMGGARFEQRRNDTVIDAKSVANVVTADKTLPAGAARDLILSQICIK